MKTLPKESQLMLRTIWNLDVRSHHSTGSTDDPFRSPRSLAIWF